ncbi:hypothetical protein RFI_31526 [Reticulomyxa filosa]|uniref:Uncharacterized protein n=1 Tax=Reticulomyxa filosa TaxID=46433 RepID=X6LX22_RETFI|nr:hypothetical protein RFI_31526 [Reticulomyxa filosa]|eukprot:ETO05871.1 hypothetical protein RFI_31526 [Reticulomyxa filosa]
MVKDLSGELAEEKQSDTEILSSDIDIENELQKSKDQQYASQEDGKEQKSVRDNQAKIGVQYIKELTTRLIDTYKRHKEDQDTKEIEKTIDKMQKTINEGKVKDFYNMIRNIKSHNQITLHDKTGKAIHSDIER